MFGKDPIRSGVFTRPFLLCYTNSNKENPIYELCNKFQDEYKRRNELRLVNAPNQEINATNAFRHLAKSTPNALFGIRWV